jgi:FHA domain
MDKAELLETFAEGITQYEKYQGFIQRAQEQSGKFTSAVVEKVVRDNGQKCEEILSTLRPLRAELESVVEGLRSARERQTDSARESQFQLEELELRLAIGDLSEEDFRAESQDYKDVVQTTDARVAEMDQERIRFTEMLDRWKRLDNETRPSADPRSRERYEDPSPRASVSARPAPAPARSAPPEYEEEPEELEAGEAEDLVIGADLEQDGLPFDQNHLSDSDPFEVDGLDLLGDEDGSQGGSRETDDTPRRAVLLYQEGTAEEQIYPFGTDVMSLGRGRDNDVQVKNDSKVSRYHCKLYRRGPNFYIEDNKSANGTLVNGELITERRLFGGEEVIIGETFFRFRILD